MTKETKNKLALRNTGGSWIVMLVSAAILAAALVVAGCGGGTDPDDEAIEITSWGGSYNHREKL